MAEHPTVRVVLASHEVLNVDADGVIPRETEYGLMLWEKLIADNDQIFLTFNGHFHGATRLTKVNDDGTWALTLSDLSAGTYDLAVAQALGARTSDALPISFEIAAAPSDPPAEEGPSGGAGGETG